MIKVDWATFKNNATTRSLSIQYVEFTAYYHAIIFDGQLEIMCLVPKDAGADCVDFETNFKNAGNKSSSDIDGVTLVRPKAAKKGATFQLNSPEFTTSTIGSLAHYDSTGANLNQCTLKFYDSNNIELTTQQDCDTLCVKTVLDFEPPFDYELIGGNARISATVNENVRLWVAAVPDIPYADGGSRMMAQNVNLRFNAPGVGIDLDGKVSKHLAYSNTLHTNKLRVTLTHPTGSKHLLAIWFYLFAM